MKTNKLVALALGLAMFASTIAVTGLVVANQQISSVHRQVVAAQEQVAALDVQVRAIATVEKQVAAIQGDLDKLKVQGTRYATRDQVNTMLQEALAAVNTGGGNVSGDCINAVVDRLTYIGEALSSGQPVYVDGPGLETWC